MCRSVDDSNRLRTLVIGGVWHGRYVAKSYIVFGGGLEVGEDVLELE